MQTLLRATALLAFAASTLHAQTTMPAPHLFAPNVISGSANDGSPTFSPDSKTLFFTRYAAHWSAILESHLVNGQWSEPTLASFSGQWPDSAPAWSPDGKYIIFVSTRPKVPLKTAAVPGQPIPGLVSNLWRVDRTATGWSEPVRLPDEVNISGAIFKPSVAANGNVYITVIGPGAAKSIYLSEFKNGAFQPATILPFSDGKKLDVDPEVAPDESYLVFSSAGRVEGDDQHERLFLVKHKDGAWTTPVLIRYLGDVNRFGASIDNEPKLGRDGSTLYFSSDHSDPTHFPRTREQAEKDLERLSHWDNSNSNIWSIDIKDLL